MIDLTLNLFFGFPGVHQAGLTTALVAGSLLTSAAGTYMQHQRAEDAQEARQRARKRRQKARKRKEERMERQQRREQQERDTNQRSLARRAKAQGRDLLIVEQGPSLGDSGGGSSSGGTSSTLG